MRLEAALSLCMLAATPVAAEIAVLTNGQTLKVGSRRLEDGLVVLGLRGGGEVGLPPEMIRGYVPDEIVDEIAAAEGDVRVLARATAERYGLDPELVLAVVAVESNFEPRAVSRKGAQGLMQLMPGTAGDLGVTDALDPATNLDGGARYLLALLRLYKGDLRKALAAYNAGPGAVARHGGVPPYRETQEYVRKVMKQYARRPPAEASP
ncbi:MAG TPA: lytic transglycosylase domain-containing protein [Vicinamibacteria bacterium]|nr:lytic transglycosylase domain-containing protein [Vicinamibacteria bacterium]